MSQARWSERPRVVRLTGRLVLMRDQHLSEPIPSVTATDLGLAAEQFGRAIASARAELPPQRRCENALRDGQPQKALQFAREAVAAYPPGVLAHVCLTWALRATGAPAVEVLDAANKVLAGDSLNPHGLEGAAVALDSLHRRDESATYWLRLANSDTADLDLTQRVVLAMVLGGSSRRAEPLIVRAADAHPDSLSFRRLEWRVTYENRHWPLRSRPARRCSNRFDGREGFCSHPAACLRISGERRHVYGDRPGGARCRRFPAT